jgi:hypothetical protein
MHEINTIAAAEDARSALRIKCRFQVQLLHVWWCNTNMRCQVFHQQGATLPGAAGTRGRNYRGMTPCMLQWQPKALQNPYQTQTLGIGRHTRCVQLCTMPKMFGYQRFVHKCLPHTQQPPPVLCPRRPNAAAPYPNAFGSASADADAAMGPAEAQYRVMQTACNPHRL